MNVNYKTQNVLLCNETLFFNASRGRESHSSCGKGHGNQGLKESPT
jgi:hypothetical protein